MDVRFELFGIGDVSLEKTVCEAVEHACYSRQELSDIREPVQYDLFHLMCDLDEIKKKLENLQQMAQLTPDIVVPRNTKNIKAFLKKVFSKIFRWYVVPMSVSQSSFNYETLNLISALLYSINIQKETIIRLKMEINEIRKKNV